MLRRVESFDHFATADRGYKGWTFAHVGASPGDPGLTIGAYGRNGTNGLRGNNNAVGGHSTRATLGVSGASGATAVLGFAFKINAGLPVTGLALARLMRGSTDLITVAVSASGTISVIRGDFAGTTLSTSASTITHSTYLVGELKVTLHDTTGAYELRIGGVNYTSGSGVDTLVSGAATWDGVGLGGLNRGVDYSIDFDDVYVCDGSGGVHDTFLGDHRIVCVVASSGNGTHADWSPSAGSDHGALVDENPPNTSDYNLSGTAGQRDTYHFAALGVSGTVTAVQTVNLLSSEAAGVRTVVPTFRISGANYDGIGAVLGSDWSYATEVHITNPATVAAWTVSEIDAAEFGVKVTV